MKRLALILGVVVASWTPQKSVPISASSSEAPQRRGLPGDRLGRMRAWMKAVRAHQAGLADEPAHWAETWPSDDVTETFISIERLVSAIRAAQAADRRTVGLIDYDGNRYTGGQLLALFELAPNDRLVADPHEMLESGALLHGDVAMLPPAVRPSLEGFGAFSVHTALTSDGVVNRSDDTSGHWIHARRLLTLVMRAPSDQDREWVKQWYRATAAWQSAERRWSTARMHLSRARDLFPDDGPLLFYTGVTHEVMGGPAIQAATDALKRLGGSFDVDGSSKELEQAAFWLGRSTRTDPYFVLGHLHVGRVLGIVGRHEEALRALVRAAAGLTDREQIYFVNLFLGYEHGMLGSRVEATADFERAASAYPWAQSPLVGLSQLARHFDDIGATHAALDRLLALRVDDPRLDPWWDYMCSHVRDANALMTGVRRSLAARSGR